MALPNPFNSVWLDTVLQKRPTKASIKQQYIGLSLFPMKRVEDYELTWDMVQAANHLAGIYAHDGRPIPGNDPDFSSVVTDIMHTMASRNISPNVVLKLRQAGELSVHNNLIRGVRRRLLRHVAERAGACEDEVDSIVEYLCMQAIQGTINWPPQTWAGAAITPAPAYWGNVAFSLSMGYGASDVQNASTLAGWSARAGGGFAWSHASANPLLDLMVIAEYLNETYGVSARNARILTSFNVLTYMSQNAQVLRWIRGDTGSPPDSMTRYINYDDLIDYVQTKIGYRIQTYDAQWTYESGLSSPSGTTETRMKFLKPGRVIILPEGIVNSDVMYFATAPDIGAPNGDRLGKYTWADQETVPPWTTEVGAGIHGFPIIRQVEGIFILEALS